MSGGGKRKREDSTQCYYCGKFGHIEPDCRIKKKGEEARKNVLGMRKRRTQMKVIDGKDRHLWSQKC
jgi:hypothetical protein